MSFSQAPTVQACVRVAGADVRYWAWGAGEPALVLVHGGAAHAGWWEPVVERLARSRRVVALDLTGHGDSDWRETYPVETWADEVAAVIDAAAGGRAVVAGHSMGGRVAPIAALRHPDRVAALVIVDSALPLPPRFSPPGERPPRIYATEDEALARFRLLPSQPIGDPGRFERIARRSVRAVDGGWTWKFDPGIFRLLDRGAPEAALPHLVCPVVLIHGELSVVTEPAMAAELARRLGRPAPLVTIPGVHHHLMLDDPAALAATFDWLPETRPG
jgi:pimeloyl-ACP methyl ester carboxylesterase